MRLALDTETTGIDFNHGCQPFFVTVCTDQEDLPTYWEWDVNPFGRTVKFVQSELDEILDMVTAADMLILQNAKFDVKALKTLAPKFVWPWEKTQDTMMAGHAISSNTPHNLTDMVLQFLGIDIEPFEKQLEAACKKAQRMARSKFKDWMIARDDCPSLPSAKKGSSKKNEEERMWKYDSWLPKVIAKRLKIDPDDEEMGHFWTVLAEYANLDSKSTYHLWQVMENKLHDMDLWAIYRERINQLRVGHFLEVRGTTLVMGNMATLKDKFESESAQMEDNCLTIANKLGCDLKLGKGGRSDALASFMFDTLKLPVYKRTDPSAKHPNGQPSMDKECFERWLLSLPEGDQLDFVRNLSNKKSRDKAVSDILAYERFSVGADKTYRHIYPFYKPTNTTTLRWSSSNPNAQNISKKTLKCRICDGDGHVDDVECLECGGSGEESLSLRYCFGPAEGREWWSMDYENIELRIPAYESNERRMIELFEKPDEPPFFGSYHLMNASIIYPEEFWPLSEKKGAFKDKYKATLYQWDKNFGFAYQYSGGEYTCDLAAHRSGAWRAVRNTLTELTKLNAHWVQYANKKGYVETLPDKTINPRRGYPIQCSTYNGNIIPTTPLNYHVQSTAMWCTGKAMTRTEKNLADWSRRTKADYFITLQVHDELVFDMPAGTGPEPWRTNLPLALKLKGLMEQSGDDIGIPLRVSVGYHPRNWGEEVKVPLKAA